MGLVVAGLTQLIYPYLYGWLLALNPLMLMALSARNIMVFAILTWAIVTLWRFEGPASELTERDEGSHAEPTTWPLGARSSAS